MLPPSGHSLLPLLFSLTVNELLTETTVHVHGANNSAAEVSLISPATLWTCLARMVNSLMRSVTGQVDGQLNRQLENHCVTFDRQLNQQVGAGKGTRSQGSRMLALQL